MDLLKNLNSNLIGLDGAILDPARISMLENLLKRRFGTQCEINSMERLRSKKNVVLHISVVGTQGSEEMVAKMFVSGDFEKELNILRTSRAAGLTVPDVIEAEDGVILMDFIPGEILVDRINRTFDSTLIDSLAQWYYNYHMIHNMIKGDPRLRNFIYNNRLLIGLDFEESRPGDWMFDIAGLSASLLDTNPIFDKRKRILAWHLLDSYLKLRDERRTGELDHFYIETVADTLHQTSHFRKSSEILALAKRVRENGIPLE